MGKRIISILDTDNLYAKRLSDYLELHSNMEYTLTSFTDVEQFSLFNASSHSFVLIVNELLCDDLFDLGLDNLNYTNLFVISESPVLANYTYEDYEFNTFFKYQSAKYLTQCFMSYIDFKKDISHNTVSQKSLLLHEDSKTTRTSKIIGIYSPIKRSGRTSFSAAAALSLSVEHSCLFLSFDENATNYFNKSSDEETFKDRSVAGLIYSYLDNNDTFVSKIHLHTYMYSNLCYSTPVASAKDIRLLDSDTICCFINALSESSYEYIVIDFGDTLCDIDSALSNCDVIFTPMLNDTLSTLKYSCFINNITQTIDKERFISISPPILSLTTSSSFFSNLMISDLLSYAHDKVMEVI